MSWVLKQSPVDDPQARLILLVLADHADANGDGAYPKRETIAEQSRVPVGTVGRKLLDLRAAGHIEETGAPDTTTGRSSGGSLWAWQSDRSDQIQSAANPITGDRIDPITGDRILV
jgi:hypothetical protein